jgi:succinate-semialdehyde dehydrogenase/glutarate-semialdehyde dehydrogenase
MAFIQDQTLIRSQCLIDGRWVDAADGATIPVTDPVDGRTIGSVPRLDAATVQQAIDAAAAAWPAWRRQSAKARAALLRRWFEAIMDHQEDLARLMTAEQGKPLAEARAEIAYAASFVEWFAEEGKRVYGDVIPSPNPAHRLVVLKQPVGVCAAITPWNFPAAMITRKAGPALAAGCPMIVKPASQTPLTALALGELAQRAGIPAGVLNVVTGDSRVVGPLLTDSPVVRKLSFTGSTAVGKHLMADCAGTVKKISLELGGNAPFIVMDDADLDAAVAGAMTSKYRNSGQTCVCTNRFLVQDGIYDAFTRRLANASAGLKVGRGTEEGVQQGPLIDQAALEKVESLIAQATADGARVVTGGVRHALGGTFFAPTVLVDVKPEMAVVREEIFGPVAPVLRFGNDKEAVQMANDTPYGLAAYCYGRNIGRVWRLAEALEYGMVGVNTGLISNEVAPFGGVKASGLGREGSRYGIEEYLEIKYVCLGDIDP